MQPKIPKDFLSQQWHIIMNENYKSTSIYKCMYRVKRNLDKWIAEKKNI